ncbi:hypothetical protein H9P43_004682 [Blastocladiella emersonii ATCC 22665]|nr:hypothetical protein H9P43_004682 [Blastocladiella emersonii ATCC 22665]
MFPTSFSTHARLRAVMGLLIATLLVLAAAVPAVTAQDGAGANPCSVVKARDECEAKQVTSGGQCYWSETACFLGDACGSGCSKPGCARCPSLANLCYPSVIPCPLSCSAYTYEAACTAWGSSRPGVPRCAWADGACKTDAQGFKGPADGASPKNGTTAVFGGTGGSVDAGATAQQQGGSAGSSALPIIGGIVAALLVVVAAGFFVARARRGRKSNGGDAESAKSRSIPAAAKPSSGGSGSSPTTPVRSAAISAPQLANTYEIRPPPSAAAAAASVTSPAPAATTASATTRMLAPTPTATPVVVRSPVAVQEFPTIQRHAHSSVVSETASTLDRADAPIPRSWNLGSASTNGGTASPMRAAAMARAAAMTASVVSMDVPPSASSDTSFAFARPRLDSTNVTEGQSTLGYVWPTTARLTMISLADTDRELDSETGSVPPTPMDEAAYYRYATEGEVEAAAAGRDGEEEVNRMLPQGSASQQHLATPATPNTPMSPYSLSDIGYYSVVNGGASDVGTPTSPVPAVPGSRSHGGLNVAPRDASLT